MAREFTILIVDDDQDMASNLQDILNLEGYTTAVAYEGQTALALCREKDFGLAIVDIKLPDMSGTELTKQLSEISHGIEHIIITGYWSMGSAIEAVGQRDIVSYEIKPVDRDRFLTLVEQVMKRRQAEEALRESENSYRTLAENLPMIVYRVFIRENNRMEFFNSMLQSMTGYHTEELMVGQVCSIEPFIVSEDQADVVRTVENAVAQNEPFELEYRFKHKDGSLRYFSERGRPIYETDGNPLYIDGVIYDITERRQMEEERQKIERLESIGTLAGGIAHDFNNLLVGVMMNVSLAKRYVEPKGQVADRLLDAEKACLEAKT